MRMWMMRVWVMLALVGVAGLAGCVPVQAQMPMPPTDTPTMAPPTATPTPTPVWFPPTATPTPLVEPGLLTPTVDVHLGVGDELFRDDFEDDALWSPGQASAGRAAIGGAELSLAVTENKGYVYSLRTEPLLDDFYLEITARPSICRGEDEYGLLLRVSKELALYRFALTCDGQVRVDKAYNGRVSSPQPLMYHGAVPPGAPSSSRLGVLAQGRELSFFVNGEFLFTVSDPSLTQGKIGVFARSDGEDQVTVNFSELVVSEAE